MPSAKQHIAAVNIDHDTLLYLLNDIDNHYKWASIVAFYKAVHIAETMFYAYDKTHSIDHDGRNRRLRRQPFARGYTHFKKLYNISLVARYLEASNKERKEAEPYLTPEKVRDKVINKWLKNFEDNCIGVIRSSDPKLTFNRV